MAEQLITHHNNCGCDGCEAWFRSGAARTGLCVRCHEPVDMHALNRRGDVVKCPARQHAA